MRAVSPKRKTLEMSKPLAFDAVRQIGLTLPDVEDGTAYGSPALKLRGRLLACIPVNKSAEADSIVVRIDIEHRAELLRQYPDIYYITDHYAPHPDVLVRLSEISKADLQELLRAASRFVLSSSSKSATSQSRPKKRAGAKVRKMAKKRNDRS